MGKKRILFSGEATFLSTGFATFNREIMRRLHETGKYELAEVSSYAPPNSPEGKKLPWKFYGVLPATENEKKIYDSNPINQFGKYKIDSILADFQPDIVFDARDPWMLEHLVTARFRSNYKLVLMPTVDSAPQKREWIKNIFSKADVLTTYSRYGKRVLESDGLGVSAVTSPGVHLDVFKPLDRATVRDEFCIQDTLLVFGTVMRNQKRKLYPDLFDAYARLRAKYAPPTLVRKAKERGRCGKKLSKAERKAVRIDHSVLYCHTSWPDVGWNLPEYIARYQLQRHVIFTYKCDACSAVFADWFAPCNDKGMRVCRLCGEHAAHMPSTHSGVDEKDLVKVFNLFDVYVQPAICEGWGLPIMESKACGVPGLYQNYSAMEDHVENGGGFPIKIARYYHEAETGAIRSLPSIDDMVEKMAKLALSDSLRKQKAVEARKCVENMHDWDKTAEKLEKIFDSLELPDRSSTWDIMPKIEFITPERPPSNLSNQDFVVWLYINILKRTPDQKGFSDWMNKLNNGGSRQEIETFFREQISSSNKFEEIRWKHSLDLRGVSQEVQPESQVKKDVVPGISV